MTSDTQTKDKLNVGPKNARRIESVRYVYRFTCYCGCGQMSEPLEKEYIRLRKNQKWSAKGCEGELEIIKEFKSGYIVSESDF